MIRWLGLKRGPLVAIACGLACVLAGARPVAARILLKNICRVKGQEENTLHGLGLVMGLKGSGDGGDFLPTIRGLSTALQLMGNNPFDKENKIGIKEAKNVALVMVTATIPAAGARQGDALDCVVSSIGSAKSLAGGTLFMTPLQGPEVPQQARGNGQAAPSRRGSDSRVYGFAQGLLHVDGLPQTVARIHKGCRLEADFFNVFSKDNKITLVLDKDHADFQVAQDIAELINSQLNFQSQEGYLARRSTPSTSK